MGRISEEIISPIVNLVTPTRSSEINQQLYLWSHKLAELVTLQRHKVSECPFLFQLFQTAHVPGMHPIQCAWEPLTLPQRQSISHFF